MPKKIPIKPMIAKPGTQEFGWIIGFLEGEGSFCAYDHLHSSSYKGKRLTYPAIRITSVVSQVQREPLERLAEYSGLGKISGPRRPRYRGVSSSKWSPIYRWTIEGRSAAEFMRVVRLFMSPKRRVQIDKALSRFDAYDLRPKVDRRQVMEKAWSTRRANGWSHPGFKGRFGNRMQRLVAVEPTTEEVSHG